MPQHVNSQRAGGFRGAGGKAHGAFAATAPATRKRKRPTIYLAALDFVISGEFGKVCGISNSKPYVPPVEKSDGPGGERAEHRKDANPESMNMVPFVTIPCAPNHRRGVKRAPADPMIRRRVVTHFIKRHCFPVYFDRSHPSLTSAYGASGPLSPLGFETDSYWSMRHPSDEAALYLRRPGFNVMTEMQFHIAHTTTKMAHYYASRVYHGKPPGELASVAPIAMLERLVEDLWYFSTVNLFREDRGCGDTVKELIMINEAVLMLFEKFSDDDLGLLGPSRFNMKRALRKVIRSARKRMRKGRTYCSSCRSYHDLNDYDSRNNCSDDERDSLATASDNVSEYLSETADDESDDEDEVVLDSRLLPKK